MSRRFDFNFPWASEEGVTFTKSDFNCIMSEWRKYPALYNLSATSNEGERIEISESRVVRRNQSGMKCWVNRTEGKFDRRRQWKLLNLKDRCHLEARKKAINLHSSRPNARCLLEKRKELTYPGRRRSREREKKGVEREKRGPLNPYGLGELRRASI